MELNFLEFDSTPKEIINLLNYCCAKTDYLNLIQEFPQSDVDKLISKKILIKNDNYVIKMDMEIQNLINKFLELRSSLFHVFHFRRLILQLNTSWIEFCKLIQSISEGCIIQLTSKANYEKKPNGFKLNYPFFFDTDTYIFYCYSANKIYKLEFNENISDDKKNQLITDVMSKVIIKYTLFEALFKNYNKAFIAAIITEEQNIKIELSIKMIFSVLSTLRDFLKKYIVKPGVRIPSISGSSYEMQKDEFKLQNPIYYDNAHNKFYLYQNNSVKELIFKYDVPNKDKLELISDIKINEIIPHDHMTRLFNDYKLDNPKIISKFLREKYSKHQENYQTLKSKTIDKNKVLNFISFFRNKLEHAGIMVFSIISKKIHNNVINSVICDYKDIDDDNLPSASYKYCITKSIYFLTSLANGDAVISDFSDEQINDLDFVLKLFKNNKNISIRSMETLEMKDIVHNKNFVFNVYNIKKKSGLNPSGIIQFDLSECIGKIYESHINFYEHLYHLVLECEANSVEQFNQLNLRLQHSSIKLGDYNFDLLIDKSLYRNMF